MIGTPEIIVIALVILLLFGGKQIPKLMKGIGRGIHAYKEGLAGKDDEDDTQEAVKPKKESESKD